MKDPLLQTYTFEELLYEYHSIAEHHKAKLEKAEEETDKIEVEKEKAGLDWADQMEAEEAAEEAARVAKAAVAVPTPAVQPPNPAEDPENIKWMEEQIQREKEIHGESFGEDLGLDFNLPEK